MKNSQADTQPTSSNAPALLFGECDAVWHTDARDFADQMKHHAPGINAYDPIGSASAFSSKMNTLKLPAMQVVSVVMSPSYLDRSSTPKATLKIPLAGEFNCLLDGQSYLCGAGLGSMYFPQGSGRAKGSGGACSQISLQFDPLLLEKTACAMLGLPGHAAVDLKLQNPRVVPLAVAGQPIGPVLQHIGALIDLHQRDARVLTQLGLQDLLYRHIALMLRPEAFLIQTSPRRSAADSAALVAQLCEYMRAHLDAGLTLSDLETFSGLSARSLQLAFKKQLGCSPMQWLTVQKLHQIHDKLTRADSSESVTSLAVTYFPNLGDFARYYRRQFGELPSPRTLRAVAASVVAGRQLSIEIAKSPLKNSERLAQYRFSKPGALRIVCGSDAPALAHQIDSHFFQGTSRHADHHAAHLLRCQHLQVHPLAKLACRQRLDMPSHTNGPACWPRCASAGGFKSGLINISSSSFS